MANELNTQAVNNSQVLSAWPTKRDSGQAAGSSGSGSVSSQGGTGKADRVGIKQLADGKKVRVFKSSGEESKVA